MGDSLKEGMTCDFVFVDASWSDFEKKDGTTIPILNLNGYINVGGEEIKVYPSLFMDPDFDDRNDGKTKIQTVLELLASYEIDVDVDEVSNNNPNEWPLALQEASPLSVWVKGPDENGRHKAYLNKRGRKSLEESEVSKLWGAVTGAPTAAAAKSDAGAFDFGANAGKPEEDDMLY